MEPASRKQEPVTSGIIWLASFPRSGNTWTRTFLHNLIKLMAGEEDAQDINAMSRYSLWDITKSLYTEALGFEPTEAHRQEIADVRARVQQRIADAFEGLVFVKTHQALLIDRGHSTINFAVTSGAVYIVRNPLDVAISFAEHYGRSIDDAIGFMARDGYETAMNAQSVYEVYGSWSQHVHSWTRQAHPAIHVMRYEDMLMEPARAFGALATHLHLDATAEQIDRAIEHSSFARLRAQEDAAGFRERPDAAARFFREGRAGQWKEVLSPAQVDRIVRDHRTQMGRFGYLDGLA